MYQARRLARYALVITLAIGSAPVLAQNSAPDSAPGGTQPAGFRSGGISAIITSTSLVPPGLVMQFIIQNGRTSPIYISPITSAGIGAGAMSSKGVLYTIGGGGLSIAGMGPCDLNGNDFNDSVSKCLKSFPTENMTYLDPGQSTIMAVSYDRRSNVEDTADNVSFVLKFLVRTAPKDADQLAVTADKPPQAGPPGVVTISFPLVPIRSQQP